MAPKKSQIFDMNWQARKAQEDLLGERPEEQVKRAHPALNAKNVVEYLLHDRNERTKKTDKVAIPQRNTDFQTIAQVKKHTHVDIAQHARVREILEGHPKIEWAGKDRLRYKVRRRCALSGCPGRFTCPTCWSTESFQPHAALPDLCACLLRTPSYSIVCSRSSTKSKIARSFGSSL